MGMVESSHQLSVLHTLVLFFLSIMKYIPMLHYFPLYNLILEILSHTYLESFQKPNCIPSKIDQLIISQQLCITFIKCGDTRCGDNIVRRESRL